MRVWCRRRPFWWLFLAPSLAISSHEESVEVTEQGETSFLADDALMNESSDKENKAVSDGPGSKFGVVQRMGLEDERRDVTVRLELSQSYMESVVGVDKSYDDVRGLCRNNDSWCTIWAIRGECERNPSFMHVDCAPACFACEKLRVTDPCAIDPNVPDALYAGGLDDLFERIAADPALQIYEPKVWSRPYYAVGDGPEHADYQLGLWLVTFENILNQEEADRIINWGLALGYHPSLAEVGFNEDGSSIDGYHENRTSSNTWCANGCDTDPVVVEIGRRIEHITGIPTENAEHLQLLRYEEGQKYDVHTDFIPYLVDRPAGVRLLTFFLYLNHEGLVGGETAFPRLGVKIQPRLGRAVLWPSVLNDDPNTEDRRSEHEALPVLQGIKYGANSWIHQRTVQSEESLQCL